MLTACPFPTFLLLSHEQPTPSFDLTDLPTKEFSILDRLSLAFEHNPCPSNFPSSGPRRVAQLAGWTTPIQTNDGPLGRDASSGGDSPIDCQARQPSVHTIPQHHADFVCPKVTRARLCSVCLSSNVQGKHAQHPVAYGPRKSVRRRFPICHVEVKASGRAPFESRALACGHPSAWLCPRLSWL